jgi:hypothetical protein
MAQSLVIVSYSPFGMLAPAQVPQKTMPQWQPSLLDILALASIQSLERTASGERIPAAARRSARGAAQLNAGLRR